VPSPEKVTGASELAALLATITLPVKLPVAAGVNVATSIPDCPGVRIKPAETPLAE